MSRPRSRRPPASTASLLLILTAATLVTGCSGDAAARSTPGATSGATSSATVTATPAASARAVASASPSSVKVGQSAALRQDVTVRVLGVRKVNLTAKGVGERAGSGAAVRLRVGNASAGPIDLGQLVVNAYYGAGRTPAVPNTTSSNGDRELAGRLAAGQSRSGTYYFTVPSAAFATLEVEVSAGDSPYVITFAHL